MSNISKRLSHAGDRIVIWRHITEEMKIKLLRLHYGAKIDSLADICKRYKVSKITAVRVLAELERAGLIEKKPGLGAVVRRVAVPVHLWFVVQDEQSRDMATLPVLARLYAGALQQAQRQLVALDVISREWVEHNRFEAHTKHGFLIEGFIYRGSEKLRSCLAKSGYHFVLLHDVYRHKGVLSAMMNRKLAGYEITRHLIEAGHRRIGFFGRISGRTIRPRFQGYRKALRQAHIAYHPEWVKSMAINDLAAIQRAIDEIWSLSPRPTALFCSSDQVAIRVMDCCGKRKISIPGDLSIVGFDNVVESALVRPKLTTIDTRLEEIGGAGVRLLLQSMLAQKSKRQACKNIYIRPLLIARESVRMLN